MLGIVNEWVRRKFIAIPFHVLVEQKLPLEAEVSNYDFSCYLWYDTDTFLVTGRIDYKEIKQSLSDLGVGVSEEMAQKILQR